MSEEKLCTGDKSCGKMLPLTDFGIIKRSGNRKGKCIKCESAMKKNNRLNNVIAKRNESVDLDKEPPTHLKNIRIAWR